MRHQKSSFKKGEKVKRQKTRGKNRKSVWRSPPPLPPYPGRANPAHPPSRVSAKALCRVFAYTLCRPLEQSFCSKSVSECHSTPFVLTRRIGGYIVEALRPVPPIRGTCAQGYVWSTMVVMEWILDSSSGERLHSACQWPAIYIEKVRPRRPVVGVLSEGVFPTSY